MPRSPSKFLVRAHLAQLAFVHHQNPIGPLDGGKAMRDDDRGAPLHQVIERLANTELGLGIDAGGGFVQDQVARIVRQRPGETDELFLARGKSAAALANSLLEAIRKRANKVEQIHTLGRRGQLFIADARQFPAGCYRPRFR